jgi:hypothetical protein
MKDERCKNCGHDHRESNGKDRKCGDCKCSFYQPKNCKCKNCEHIHERVNYDRIKIINDWRELQAIWYLFVDTLKELGVFKGFSRRVTYGVRDKFQSIYILEPCGTREVQFDLSLAMMFSACLSNPEYAMSILCKWMYREFALMYIMNSRYFGFYGQLKFSSYQKNILQSMLKHLNMEQPNGCIFTGLYSEFASKGDWCKQRIWKDGLSTFDPYSKYLTVCTLERWVEKTGEKSELSERLVSELKQCYNSIIRTGVINRLKNHLTPPQFVHVLDRKETLYEGGKRIPWEESKVYVNVDRDVRLMKKYRKEAKVLSCFEEDDSITCGLMYVGNSAHYNVHTYIAKEMVSS